MEWYQRPQYVVGVGIAVALAAFPVLYGAGQLIRLACIGVGLAVSISLHGLAASALGAAWIAPFMGVGVGTAGLGIGALVVVRVSSELGKAPYEWAVPCLAVLAGFLTDLCKDFALGDNAVAQAVFAAIMAALIVVGGFLIHRGSLVARLCGILVVLICPSVVLLLLVTAPGSRRPMTQDLTTMSAALSAQAIGLAAVAVITVLVIVLGIVVKPSASAKI
jgi:hypothetical protein